MTPFDPADCSPPGSSVHGILQARRLEWVAISSSGESSRLREQTHVCCVSRTGRRVFTTEPRGSPGVRCRLSFIRHCSCSRGIRSCYLITSRRLHLQMPSHWALGFQNEEYTIIQTIFKWKKKGKFRECWVLFTLKSLSHVCVCVYLYVCVCMCLYAYACMYLCLYTYFWQDA